MGGWTFALGGLVIWAAHFMLIYGFGSVWPGDPLANLLTIAATLPALAGNAWILFAAMRYRLAKGGDEASRWLVDLGALGAILSFVAVLWQSLPALLLPGFE